MGLKRGICTLILTLACATPASAAWHTSRRADRAAKVDPVAVALKHAYAYWQHKPCAVHAIYINGHSTDWGTGYSVSGCFIALNTTVWTRPMLRYWVTTAAREGDPYGQETWYALCHSIIADVGDLAGIPDSTDPRSMMYPAFVLQRREVGRWCGRHA